MTSNREWLNGLATSDVSALNAWMDAEHVESANGTSDGARTALDAKNDSRGKLEADIQEYLACEYGCIPGIVAVYPDWLDRQAAITRAECMGGFDGFLEARVQERTAELRGQVDNLRSDLHAARSDAEYYRGKLGDVLDCVCEALRVGTLDVNVVDRNGEVVT